MERYSKAYDRESGNLLTIRRTDKTYKFAINGKEVELTPQELRNMLLHVTGNTRKEITHA